MSEEIQLEEPQDVCRAALGMFVRMKLDAKEEKLQEELPELPEAVVMEVDFINHTGTAMLCTVTVPTRGDKMELEFKRVAEGEGGGD